MGRHAVLVAATLMAAMVLPTAGWGTDGDPERAVTMVNPSGDPMESSEALEGQNEFTFNGDPESFCEIRCEASVFPDTQANRDWADEHVGWAISPGIAGSDLKWYDKDEGTGEYTEADSTGRVVYARFIGLPEHNDQFGTKTVTMPIDGTPSGSNLIQLFYSAYASNHPGNEPGTPNWYYYWRNSYGPIEDHTTFGACHGLGEIKGMAHWYYEYVNQGEFCNKITVFFGQGAQSESVVTNGIEEPKEWTGIDLFYNIYLHEGKHKSQIIMADNIVGLQPDTCWRYGWSWHRLNHNHWALGSDGQPGVANVDDDNDGLVDNLTLVPGEVGKGDDEDLSMAIDGLPGYSNWPARWSLPDRPWYGFAESSDPLTPIEHEAILNMTYDEHQWWSRDWGSPGKQHHKNKKYDD